MTKKGKKKRIYQKPKVEKFGDISTITMGDEDSGLDHGTHHSGD